MNLSSINFGELSLESKLLIICLLGIVSLFLAYFLIKMFSVRLGFLFPVFGISAFVLLRGISKLGIAYISFGQYVLFIGFCCILSIFPIMLSNQEYKSY